MPDLKASEWLIVLATLAGPILAVQAQKFVERARERRQQKLRIFYSLMATRATRLSADHVQALNMIDIEFYGSRFIGFRFQSSKEKKVVEAWRIYHDHLNQHFESETLSAWAARGDELFTDVLHAMSIALGYDFDKVQLKRGIYTPKAHGEHEDAQLIIRDSLVKILSGEKAFPMAVTSFPTSEEAFNRQCEIQKQLLDYLTGTRTLKVSLAEAPCNSNEGVQPTSD